MKPTRITPLTLTLLLLALSCGCRSQPERNQVRELLDHPQFPAARQAAPEWSKKALEAVNDLQKENTKLKIR